MEILKLVVPAITGALGLVKLLDRKSPAMRVVTTALIILGGAGSAVLVQESGKVEERRAVAAEQAQLRAEEKLDKMSDALLDIQTDLAKLQGQLVKVPAAASGPAGATLSATLQKVRDASQIVGTAKPPVENKPPPVEKKQPLVTPKTPAAKPGAATGPDDK